MKMKNVDGDMMQLSETYVAALDLNVYSVKATHKMTQPTAVKQNDNNLQKMDLFGSEDGGVDHALYSIQGI